MTDENPFACGCGCNHDQWEHYEGVCDENCVEEDNNGEMASCI